jgi:hypothetical protein
VSSGKVRQVEGLMSKDFKNRKLRIRLSSQADIAAQYEFPLRWGQGSNAAFGMRLSSLMRNPRISYGFRFALNY